MTDFTEIASPRQEPRFSSNQNIKPEPRTDAAAEVGYWLARERISRGLSFEDAAEATGIHPYHLNAIELGDLTHMPPRLEAIEMIAGYAQYLGFDPDPLVGHLASALPPPPVRSQPRHSANPPVLSSARVLKFGKMPKVPSFRVELSKFPSASTGLISSVAAAFVLLAGAHWALSGHGAQSAAAGQVAVVQPAAPTQDLVATASTAPPAADAKSIAQPAKVASADDVPQDPDAIGAFIQDKANDKPAKAKPVKVASASAKIQDRIKVEDQLKTASAAPIPQASEGRNYGAENKDAHVILKATAPVWLRVEDAQGVAVMTQMMNTGDTYRVPNRDGLVALSRDGGRLAYSIDGRQIGVLGPPGKILVSEKLDMAALAAKKPTATN